MKDLKVSNETHSLLFSIKNKLAVSHNKKFTFDEVIKFILSHQGIPLIHAPMGDVLNDMYQLEEKP